MTQDWKHQRAWEQATGSSHTSRGHPVGAQPWPWRSGSQTRRRRTYGKNDDQSWQQDRDGHDQYDGNASTRHNSHCQQQDAKDEHAHHFTHHGEDTHKKGSRARSTHRTTTRTQSRKHYGAHNFFDGFQFSKKQREILDQVLPADDVRMQSHESFSTPPLEEDMRRLWVTTKRGRIARLADQAQGARAVGVDDAKIVAELSVNKAMLLLTLSPDERVHYYRRCIDTTVRRKNALKDDIRKMQTELDNTEGSLRILRALLQESKSKRDDATPDLEYDDFYSDNDESEKEKRIHREIEGALTAIIPGPYELPHPHADIYLEQATSHFGSQAPDLHDVTVTTTSHVGSMHARKFNGSDVHNETPEYHSAITIDYFPGIEDTFLDNSSEMDSGNFHLDDDAIRTRLLARAFSSIVSKSHNMKLNDRSTTNTTGEIMAIVQALMWSIAVAEPQPICIHTDCETAINICMGRATASADEHLARFMKVIFDTLKNENDITLHHVPSHEGMPWNELADGISKRTRKRYERGHDYDTIPHNFRDIIADTKYYQWESILQPDHPDRAAYPLREGATLRFGLPTRNASVRHLMAPKTVSAKETKIELSIATYNAESVRESDAQQQKKFTKAARLAHQWRGPLLRRQFQEKRLHIIGIQEARNERRTTTGNGYFIISSPHDHYNAGCELWINVEEPYAYNKDGPQHFEPRHCHVLISEPRILIVKVTTDCINTTICVFHAPHSKKGPQERQDFWQRLQKLVQQHRPNLMLADANGRLGSVQSTSVGPAGLSQTEDSNGKELHEIAAAGHYVIANTVISNGDEHHTWTDAYGHKHRIDYIIADDTLISHITDVKTLADIETMKKHRQGQHHREDHLPVTARACWTVRHTAPKQLFPKIDKHQLNDEKAVETFKMHLDATVLPSWGTDYDEHIHQYMLTIMDAATSAFKRSGKKKYQEYISETTLDFVLSRRKFMKLLRKATTHGATASTTKRRIQRLINDIHNDPTLQMTPEAIHTTYCETYMLNYAAANFPYNPDYHGFLQHVRHWIDATRKVIVKMTDRDYDAFLEEQAQKAMDAKRTGDTYTEWKYTKKLLLFGGRKRRKRQAYPMMNAADGTVLDSSTSKADAATRHFGHNEAADILSAQDVVDRYNAKEDRTDPAQPRRTRHVNNFASIYELTDILHKARPHRAPGPDRVSDDFSKIAPRQMARHMHPIITKAALFCREGVALKGSRMTYFWKGKGSEEDLNNQRSITLANTVIKHHYRYIRQCMKDLIPTMLFSTQTGGRHHYSTDINHMTMRLLSNTAYHLKHDMVIIMIDLKAAFHKVVNQLVYNFTQTKEQLDDLLAHIDIPHVMLPAIEALMTDNGIVNQHVDNQHIVDMLTEAHTGTWFYIDDQCSYAAPRLGTRPGVPTADFTFNMLMADVTRDYHDHAVEDGATFDIPHAPPRLRACDHNATLSSTSFVDDVKAAASTADGTMIHALITKMWGHLIRATLRRGLPINTKKSSFIVYPNTVAGKRATRTMIRDNHSITDMGLCVTIARSTKLLGAMFNDRNDMGQETAARTIALRETTGPLRRTLFQRQAISIQTKIHYLESFGYSRLLFNAGTWLITTARDYHRINTAYVTAARQAIGITHKAMKDKHITNEQILARAQLPNLEDRLRWLRLRELLRLIKGCPYETQALIDYDIEANGTWTQTINNDIHTCRQHCDGTRITTAPKDIIDFIKAARNDMHTVKSFITSTYKRAQDSSSDRAAQDQLRADLSLTATALGVPPLPRQAGTTTPAPARVMCYHCGATFKTKAAHNKHVYAVHQDKHTIDNYIVGDTCQVCLKYFYTANRLTKHVKSSHQCAATLMQFGAKPPTEDIDAHKEEDDRYGGHMGDFCGPPNDNHGEHHPAEYRLVTTPSR
ncbi:unnamed protein product [Prorocentrum cordatum]|uniref:C2H2-type domain-containing protein n=1 Tax=Prorocentrum cordatum TaxID=2364126 RepID=A0ABN9PYZ8_9DINO|nr:unnamed protein product [Polarella glacialis]